MNLSVLAVIDPSRIPLHLILNGHLIVESDDLQTRTWLASALESSADALEDTQTSAATPPPEPALQTSNAILLKVDYGTSNARHTEDAPRVTELVIVGSRYGLGFGTLEESMTEIKSASSICLPDFEDDGSPYGSMTLHALCLSSDLLYKDLDVKDLEVQNATSKIITQPASGAIPATTSTLSKRDRLSQLFDEATDRRKRPRLSSHSAASATPDMRERSMSRGSSTFTSPALPQDGFSIDDLNLQPSASTIKAPVVPERRVSGSRALSPAVGGSDTRPQSRKGGLERTSTLLSQSFTADTMLEQQIATRNKEVISRAVLAGMKTYGLTSYKGSSRSRKSITGGESQSATAGEIEDVIMETGEESQNAGTIAGGADDGNEEKDQEYKNVYHQTNKGVVFAYRNSIGSTMLRQDAVREVVDKLLAVFCVEPG